MRQGSGRRVRGQGRRVENGAAVDVGLGHAVARRAGRGRAGGERRDGAGHGRERVGHGDVAQCHVARIGHVERVGQDVAGLGETGAECALGKGRGGLRRACHGHAVGPGDRAARRCNGRHVGRVGQRSRIHIGLGQRVAARAARGRGWRERRDRADHTADQRVGDEYIVQRDIARIAKVEGEAQRFTRGRKCRVQRDLVERDRWRARAVHGHRNGRGHERAIGGESLVGDGARIHIGLRDRVVRLANLRRAGHEIACETVDRADAVVLDAGRARQGQIAVIAQREAIAQHVARRREVCVERLFGDGQGGVLVGGNGLGHLRRGRAATGRGRQIGDLACIDVGLGRRVAGGAGQRRRRRETASGKRRAGHVGDAVVRDRDRIRQGRVARIGDDVFVSRDIAGQLEVHGCGGLGHAHGGRLVGVHRRGGRRRGERAAGRRAGRGRDVGHLACIDVGLGDGVGRGAGDRLPRIQHGVAIALPRHVAADRRDAVIAEHQIGDRDIARVRDEVGVVQHVARRGKGRRVRRLDEGERGELLGVDRVRGCRIGQRAACRRAGRGRDVGHRARIQIGLGDGVGARADHGLAGIERVVAIALRGHGADHVVDPVIRDGYRADADIAGVRQGVAIGQHVADRVEARLVGRLGKGEFGRLRGAHGRAGVGRRGAAAHRAGRVGQRARVQIVLRDGVVHGAGERGIRRKAARGQRVAHHGARRLHAVVVHGDRVRERDVARIGDGEVVGQDLAERVEGRVARDLHQRQRRHLVGVDGRRVGRRGERAAGRRAGQGRHIGHRTRIDVGLGDGVGGGARRARTRRQRGDGAGDSRDPVVRHGDAVDAHIAGVGDVVFVVERVADRRKGRIQRALDQRQHGRLRRADRGGVGERGQRAASRRGRQRRRIGHRARIEIGLGDRVRARAGRGLARGERGDRAGDSGDPVIGDGHAADADIACVGHVVFIGQRVAHGRECRVQRALGEAQGGRGRFGLHARIRRGRRQRAGLRVRIHARRVGDGSARIDIGLSHRVGRRERGTVADIEHGHAGRADGGQRSRAAVDVADAHIAQRGIAGVGRRVGVGDRFADAEARRLGRGLGEAEARRGHFRPDARARIDGAERARRRGGVNGRRIGDRRARIDVGLGEGVGRGEGRTIAGGEARHAGRADGGQRTRAGVDVRHGDGVQPDIAGVGNDIGIGDRVARRQVGRDVRRLSQRGRWNGRGHAHGLVCRDGRQRAACGRGAQRGGVGDRILRVDVGLLHGVAGREGDAVADGEAGNAGGRDGRERSCRGVRIGHRHAGQRDRARIRGDVGVGDRIASAQPGRVRRGLGEGHGGRGVGERDRSVRIHGRQRAARRRGAEARRVGDRTARIHIGLGDRVGGRERRIIAGREAGDAGGRDGGQRARAVVHVAHADVLQRDIARIGDSIAVGHDIAERGVGGNARRLGERGCRRWRSGRHGGRPGRRGEDASRRGRIERGRVGDRRARIDICLLHDIGRRERHAVAHGERGDAGRRDGR